MKIAVVILNWNGKQLLQQFLPSVVANSPEADVYVVDNASTDVSVDYVTAHFPRVKIIVNVDNYGYAKGYNEALKKIDADVFCLLNSDVEVTPNWLTPIKHTFQKEPNTAIIQPKLLDYKNRTHFEYAGAAGGFIDTYGYPFCRGRIFNTIEEDRGQYDDTTNIFWASGACLFIRNSVFKELDGLDEAFFAHFEEIDLCWRAFNSGHDTKYVGTSTIYHVGGATLSNTNPKKTYLNFRNSLFAITKNAHGNLFLLIITRLLLDGAVAFKFLIEGKLSHILAILRAHSSFYRHLPALLSQRRYSVQKRNYSHQKSIVWSYFVRKQKNYNSL
ncbi:MAG TPA: glycosyltransferase family 2 protein [Aquaticitalea sp.]|nr:glycosyltransferase family 2 protein [Aquaticitalea sp.]